MELRALAVLQYGEKTPYYSLSGRLMGPRTGPEKGSLAIAGNWNIFPRSSSPCSSLYRLRYSVSRTDWKYAMNTRDRQKHSTVTRHSLFCRDELRRRHQSQLWILGGGGLHSERIDQSRPLSQCACFCYEDLWAEVHTCSLEVWACHGSESYKQYPDSLSTRTFTFPTRMVLQLRRPNFKRTVHIYISIRKNVLALKTRLLPYAAFCGCFKRRQMKIR